MRVIICNFSGYKIYPGHGKVMVKSDGRILTFVSSKAERCYLLKRNPRKVSWTELYRRKHRKGLEQEVIRRKSRHVRKIDKGISGKSLTEILAIRRSKPEIKRVQKAEAIKIAKKATKLRIQKQNKFKIPMKKAKNDRKIKILRAANFH